MIIVKQLTDGCSVNTAKEHNFVHAIFATVEKINQAVLTAKMEKLKA